MFKRKQRINQKLVIHAGEDVDGMLVEDIFKILILSVVIDRHFYCVLPPTAFHFTGVIKSN